MIGILDCADDRMDLSVDPEDAELDPWYWFGGEPIQRLWEPIRVEALSENPDLPMGDFTLLDGIVPMFSERAVAALGEILRANGQVLPVRCDRGEYFAYNCTRVVDALDHERTVLSHYVSGAVRDVIKYEFRPEAVEGLLIFKIPETRPVRVYVTDEFMAEVDRHPLTGFRFQQVWPDPPDLDGPPRGCR